MNKNIILCLVLIGIFLVSGCDTSERNKQIKIEEDIRNIEFSCQSDYGCDWVITNCCRENAGAFWQCANKIESIIVCPEGKYECTAEEKPKPLRPCDCIDNKCQEKEIKQLEEEKNEIAIENKTTLIEEDTNIWVSINPHQCGDYRVPNSIYYDYPNGGFPGYNASPTIPLLFIVKNNMLELFSTEGLSSIEAEIMYQSIVNLSRENNNDFFDKYAKTNIIIYDYKKIDRNMGVCAACGCPVGYNLFLLISEFDVPKLQKIGYELSSERIIKTAKYCNKDEDCIKVRGNCCGCGGGGTATAINKSYSNYWENLNCFCPGVMSDHWTCFAEPRCIENQCKLVQ